MAHLSNTNFHKCKDLVVIELSPAKLRGPDLLNHFQSMFHFYTSENIKKSEVFCFQGVQKWNTVWKRFKEKLQISKNL